MVRRTGVAGVAGLTVAVARQTVGLVGRVEVRGARAYTALVWHLQEAWLAYHTLVACGELARLAVRQALLTVKAAAHAKTIRQINLLPDV